MKDTTNKKSRLLGDDAKTLAKHISAVLQHPLTPQSIRDALGESVNDLAAVPDEITNQEWFIEGVLSSYVSERLK